MLCNSLVQPITSLHPKEHYSHRFVAERGDSGQMTLVDNIDIKYGLKMPTAKSNQTNADELAGIKPKQDERRVEKKTNRIKTTANMGAPTTTLK